MIVGTKLIHLASETYNVVIYLIAKRQCRKTLSVLRRRISSLCTSRSQVRM
jgi:hypothetical protein